jgi:hypothetical protein
LERQGYIAVSIMFVTRNAGRPEYTNNGNLQFQCREGGMPGGHIAGCRDRLVDHLKHSLVCAIYHAGF